MGNGLALVRLLPLLLIACGGKTERYGQELGGNPPSTAGTDGGTAGSTSNGGGGFERCAFTTVTQPDQMFPPTSPSAFPSSGTIDATVLAVTDAGLDLETAFGASHFGWAGPALVNHFAPSDTVQLDTFTAWESLSPEAWYLLTSDATTLATLAGSWTIPLSTRVGDPIALTTPPKLPRLEFVNAGCCKLDGSIVCDYSPLNAALGEQSVRIAPGDTGTLAGWTITNRGAMYSQNSLRLAVSLIRAAR